MGDVECVVGVLCFYWRKCFGLFCGDCDVFEEGEGGGFGDFVDVEFFGNGIGLLVFVEDVG